MSFGAYPHFALCYQLIILMCPKHRSYLSSNNCCHYILSNLYYLLTSLFFTPSVILTLHVVLSFSTILRLLPSFCLTQLSLLYIRVGTNHRSGTI